MKKKIIVLNSLIIGLLVWFFWNIILQKQKMEVKQRNAIHLVSHTNIVASAVPSEGEKLKKNLKDAYDRINALEVKGKVVDHEGNAVSGVIIKIAWETAGFLIGLPYDHNKHTQVYSDENGEWSFQINKPNRVYIDDAQKVGYAFEKQRSTNKNLVDIREATKQNPVEALVCMRKKNEEVLLLKYPNGQSDYDLWLWTNNGTNSLTVVDVLDPLCGGNKRNIIYNDLQVSVNFDALSKMWTLVFNAPNGNDGIVDQNEILYEAPEKGYKKAVSFMVSLRDRRVKDRNYLYLKSRQQSVYTRICYYYDSFEEPHTGPNFRLYLGTATNPYGERSFEDATGLRKYTFARDELLEEAKKAIQAGKLPKKPVNPEKYLQERDKILEDKWRNPNR